MKPAITIEARCYPVRVADDASGEELNDQYVLSASQLRDASDLGLTVQELVERHYRGLGCTVLSIGPERQRTITLDLGELYLAHCICVGVGDT